MRAFTVFSVVLAVLTACAPTYYYRNYNFNTEFENGNLPQALEALKADPKLEESKARFIYYLNNGLVLSILGKYEESNAWFEKAYLFGEDYHINYLTEAGSYLVNPMITLYRGEDHEHLLLLYFKAINFLKLNKPEEALVECRRLNIRLGKLSDKYKSEKKFQRDAFVHTLMGIIYQSTKDYNNAFIAYRNAVEIYESDYASMFGMDIPEQLKKDLLSTAWWTGFNDEFERFKEKFGMPDFKPSKPEAELVFFWHNGLGPVKGEWSIEFIINQNDNHVVFANDKFGFAFPYRVDERSEQNKLSDLHIYRASFPKYFDRPVYYQSAELQIDSAVYRLEEGENVSKVAFYTLEQRMMLEFSKGLLRAATKKIAEHSVRKEEEWVGAVVGLANAISERADTRNWQTLPHSIYYSRVPLKQGENVVKFVLKEAHGEDVKHEFVYKALRHQTLFHTFSSLETSGVNRIAGSPGY